MPTPVMNKQTAVVVRDTNLSAEAADLDPAIQSIISKARASVPRAPGRGSLILGLLSGGLLYASFRPIDFAPLGWIAVVPLLLLVRLPHPTRWMKSSLYLSGLVYFLATLQWMRLGDVSMYPAWLALAAYLAVFFPLFVVCTRACVWRLQMPLTLAAPMVWVGLEFARAYLFTGFSWYYLGHSQYRWTGLIQVSDLVGAYGVSFLMVMTAATLALLVTPRWFQKLRLVLPATGEVLTPSPQAMKRHVIISLTVFAAVVGYGYWRLSSASFENGPRVALIQGNFTSSVKHNPEEIQTIYNEHYSLTTTAVHVGRSPDLIVWPETMFRSPLMVNQDGLDLDQLRAVSPQIDPNWWDDPRTVQLLSDMSQQTSAAMIIGLESWVARDSGVSFYNSAAFLTPDGGISGRYDKLHRVPFGEYVPLRDEVPFLKNFSPYGPDSGIDRGLQPTVFAYQDWRAAPVICFEDTVPHLVRDVMRATRHSKDGREVDYLVNLTNDGWFHGSSELDQHLITAAFRCVENRVPMIRAVNTGVSAVIDGNGTIVEPEMMLDGDGESIAWLDPDTGRWRKQLSAAVIHPIPLDGRTSLYTRFGDWFAGLCLIVTVMASILAILRTWAARRAAPAVAV